MRKQRTNVVGDAIIDAFSKRKVCGGHCTAPPSPAASFSRLSLWCHSQVVPAPDAPCAVHIYCHRGHGAGRRGRGVSDDSDDSDDSDAGRRRRRGVTVVQYLDADGLSEFIKTAEKQQDGAVVRPEMESCALLALTPSVPPLPAVLQRFVAPRGASASVIRATWTPALCLLERRTNRHGLGDTREGVPMPQRCITFEATEADAVSEPIHSGVLAERVRSAAASIVRHVAAVSHGAAVITRAVLHFQLGSDDALYFLYATSLRLQPTQSAAHAAAGARGGGEGVGRPSRVSELPSAAGAASRASGSVPAAVPHHRHRDDPLVPRAALPAVLSQPKVLRTGLDLDPRYVVPRHTDGAPRLPSDVAPGSATMRSADGSSSEDASAFRLGATGGTLNSTALTGLHALPTLMGRTITAKVVVPPSKHVSSIPPLQRAAARAAKHENLVARARARTASAAAAASAWEEAAGAPRRATDGDALPSGSRPLAAFPSGEFRRKTADPGALAVLAAPKPRRTDGHDPVSWGPSSRGSPGQSREQQSAVSRRPTGSGTPPVAAPTSAYGKLNRGSAGVATQPQRPSGGVAGHVAGGKRPAQPDPAVAAAAIDAAVAQAQAALEAGHLHGVELPEKVAELLRRTSLTLDAALQDEPVEAPDEPATDETPPE